MLREPRRCYQCSCHAWHVSVRWQPTATVQCWYCHIGSCQNPAGHWSVESTVNCCWLIRCGSATGKGAWLRHLVSIGWHVRMLCRWRWVASCCCVVIASSFERLLFFSEGWKYEFAEYCKSCLAYGLTYCGSVQSVSVCLCCRLIVPLFCTILSCSKNAEVQCYTFGTFLSERSFDSHTGSIVVCRAKCSASFGLITMLISFRHHVCDDALLISCHFSNMQSRRRSLIVSIVWPFANRLLSMLRVFVIDRLIIRDFLNSCHVFVCTFLC